MINDKNLLTIKLDNVCFGYTPDQMNLSNVSFNINKNDFIAIVGRNGSGKSTLAKILIGMLKPMTGLIYINDVELSTSNINSYKNKVGAVLEQSFDNFFCDTVEEEIAFGLENKNISREEISKIILEVSKLLNIEHLLKLNPNNLSGGEKQKVCIACCLANRPEIILFDEVTSMLDPLDKIEIRNILIKLHKLGKVIITITHDSNETLEADRIILVDDGKIIVDTYSKDFFFNIDVRKYGLNEPLSISLSKMKKLNLKLKGTKNGN